MGFFAPAAGAAVKFNNIGDSVYGRISGPLSERQATYNGTPRTTKKNQPVMEVVVPLVDADGNERTLYVSAWRMKRAITDAVVVAGAKDIEEGGLLTVTYSGTEQGEGSQPAKTFTVQYTAPGGTAAPAAPAAPAAAQQPQAPQQYAQQPQAPQQYAPQAYQQPAQAPQQVYQNYQQPAAQQPYQQAPAPLSN